MARIVCERLTKRYGSVESVKDLNLEILDTEFLVLLGPSGCGKTTTLNMIAGLEEITEGTLLFDETIVNYVPPHKRNIAMVFQSYALYPQKTVYENIAFGLRLMKTPRDEVDRRVNAAADQLEISHLLQRRPSQLSGGQRQRVALGRAIVRRPSVFLMDEPLSNLDAALRLSTRSLIKRLHNSMRTTFVYVTHDQAEAMTLADRIVVMDHGRIQQIGTPDEIYNRPANLFVATFLGTPRMNLIEGTLRCDSGRWLFVREGLSLGVGKEIPAGSEERAVWLGIRPEDVEVQRDASGDNILLCKAGLVSSVGSEKYIECCVADTDMTFRLNKDITVSESEELPLAMNLGRLHLFDRETGAAI